MRLTADDWQATAGPRQVTVHGLDACLPWFGITS
jgi:hypothetical protein